MNETLPAHEKHLDDISLHIKAPRKLKVGRFLIATVPFSGKGKLQKLPDTVSMVRILSKILRAPQLIKERKPTKKERRC